MPLLMFPTHTDSAVEAGRGYSSSRCDRGGHLAPAHTQILLSEIHKSHQGSISVMLMQIHPTCTSSISGCPNWHQARADLWTVPPPPPAALLVQPWLAPTWEPPRLDTLTTSWCSSSWCPPSLQSSHPKPSSTCSLPRGHSYIRSCLQDWE